jgi:hypothetical protein
LISVFIVCFDLLAVKRIPCIIVAIVEA